MADSSDESNYVAMSSNIKNVVFQRKNMMLSLKLKLVFYKRQRICSGSNKRQVSDKRRSKIHAGGQRTVAQKFDGRRT